MLTVSTEIDKFVYEDSDIVSCFAAGNNNVGSNGDGVWVPDRSDHKEPLEIVSQLMRARIFDLISPCNTVSEASSPNRATSNSARIQLDPTLWLTAPTGWWLSAVVDRAQKAASSPTSWRLAPASCLLDLVEPVTLVYPSTRCICTM